MFVLILSVSLHVCRLNFSSFWFVCVRSLFFSVFFLSRTVGFTSVAVDVYFLYLPYFSYIYSFLVYFSLFLFIFYDYLLTYLLTYMKRNPPYQQNIIYYILTAHKIFQHLVKSIR